MGLGNMEIKLHVEHLRFAMPVESTQGEMEVVTITQQKMKRVGRVYSEHKVGIEPVALG